MIATIIVGIFVGVFAKLLMPGKDPRGWIITCLLGISGSIVAHFLGVRAGVYAEAEPVGFVASVLGAILILALYRVLLRKTATK